jgi:hypothetical protein|tara:strand:- start:1366 stop:1713 length:348 start_codon:yes stop_codon:yes gene_type:complete
MKKFKTFNETEITRIVTQTGTYYLVIEHEDNQYQIKKGHIVLRRFENNGHGLQQANNWILCMKESNELENENYELRAEITEKLTTGERIKFIFAKLDENWNRLSYLRQQMYPLNY